MAAGAAQLVDSLPEGFAVKGINGSLDDVALIGCEGFAAVASQAKPAKLQAYRQALAERSGALLPLLTEPGAVERYVIERHLCVDTTAAGECQPYRSGRIRRILLLPSPPCEGFLCLFNKVT
ncbi:hypothetical protein [Aliamphritea spongicola]|nr:hypothetical protein [Aliamphritea spongicola]